MMRIIRRAFIARKIRALDVRLRALENQRVTAGAQYAEFCVASKGEVIAATNERGRLAAALASLESEVAHA